MKRLFQVNTSPVSFFENKKDAKVARGDLILAKDDKPAHYSLRVSKGPDHTNFSIKGGQKTHSHNAKSGGHGNGFPNPKKRR